MLIIGETGGKAEGTLRIMYFLINFSVKHKTALKKTKPINF